MTTELLLLRSRLRKPFELTVSGTSMLPILHPGDAITVCSKEHYECGDILVFIYKNNELLVHRLLKIENERYFCKGDNSFRLEDISKDRIIGAVIHNDDKHNTKDFIEASYTINRIFRRHKYDTNLTMTDPEYLRFKEKYLENNMRYKKNLDIELIDIDEDTLAAYNNATGEIHYLNKTGRTILKILETEHSLSELVCELCNIYTEPSHDIEEDVNLFIEELLSKKVVSQSDNKTCVY